MGDLYRLFGSDLLRWRATLPTNCPEDESIMPGVWGIYFCSYQCDDQADLLWMWSVSSVFGVFGSTARWDDSDQGAHHAPGQQGRDEPGPARPVVGPCRRPDSLLAVSAPDACSGTPPLGTDTPGLPAPAHVPQHSNLATGHVSTSSSMFVVRGENPYACGYGHAGDFPGMFALSAVLLCTSIPAVGADGGSSVPDLPRFHRCEARVSYRSVILWMF
jgi:hypothetical protein